MNERDDALQVINNLPTISSDKDQALSAYISYVRQIPTLTHEEEIELMDNYYNKNDQKSGNKIVLAHLKLVVSMAYSLKGYGLPMMDLISEGNVGLMKALKKFNPAKGMRFSTYAIWWIKATIHDYIMKSWSIVKLGTTKAHRKLFFNLQKIQNKLSKNGNFSTDDVAHASGVNKSEVIALQNIMNARNNEFPSNDHLDVKSMTSQDTDMYQQVEAEDTNRIRMKRVNEILSTVPQRDAEIFKMRYIEDDKTTLEDISKIYDISKERVRQISENVMKKLRNGSKDL
jgi:RNA polymerase sigma-32 factor